MNTYKTAEVAAIIGIHPNTVRLYEKLGLIPEPKRQPNGYRLFTDYHIEQFKLARLAFQVEVLQNGLRRKIVLMVKASAEGDFDKALALTCEYLTGLRQERANAEEAIEIVKSILRGAVEENKALLRRKEVSELLDISMDTLRNWEMNGLLTVKRRQNGYRVYDEGDVRRLKIIRSLRCANYSLEAILNMLCQLSRNPQADIRTALNTPREGADIISVYDRLLTALSEAEENANLMTCMLKDMKIKFS